MSKLKLERNIKTNKEGVLRAVFKDMFPKLTANEIKLLSHYCLFSIVDKDTKDSAKKKLKIKDSYVSSLNKGLVKKGLLKPVGNRELQIDDKRILQILKALETANQIIVKNEYTIED